MVTAGANQVIINAFVFYPFMLYTSVESIRKKIYLKDTKNAW